MYVPCPLTNINCTYCCDVVSEQIVLAEPLVLEAANKVQWSRTQQYEAAVKRGVRFMELAIQHNWNLDELNIALG